jgi:hypothetical protein
MMACYNHHPCPTKDVGTTVCVAVCSTHTNFVPINSSAVDVFSLRICIGYHMISANARDIIMLVMLL